MQLIIFLVGFGIFMFSRRSDFFPTIACAIIVAPIFILRFSRTQKRHAIALTFVGFLLSLNIALFGKFNLGSGIATLVFTVIRSSLLAVLFFLPYMLDRLIYGRVRLPGSIRTLVFPVMVTAILFLSSLKGPFDGDVAKDIYAQGPLFFQQTASLFGLWGFVFLFSWIASFVNQLWENKFEWRAVRSSLTAILSAFLLLSAFGLVKINISSPANPDTVKIAAAVLILPDGRAVPMGEIFKNKQPSPFESTMNRIEKMTQEAARASAKVISFQEFAIIIAEEDREKLLKILQRIAEENRLYLNLAYAYFVKEGKGENMNVLIGPDGAVLIHYPKRYLLGFGDVGEPSVFKKGPGIILTANTPYGVIGVSTCRDMSFPPFIRQAGKMNVDLMLGPSYDFPKSDYPSYYLRAIENGFSFVRSTYNGISYAIDYNGNILAATDFQGSKDGIMYARIPVKGVRTLYSRTGDWLGWVSVLAAIFFASYAFMRKRFDARISSK